MSETKVDALIDGTTTVMASWTTGLDGIYSLPLEDGTYDLRVTPPTDSGFGLQTVQNVSLSGADRRYDIILIAQGGTVAGQVRGHGGTPLPEIDVYVSDNSNGTFVTSTTTDAQGRYSLALAAGTFRFHLYPRSYPAGAPNQYWWQEVFEQQTGGTTTIDFDLPVAKVQGTVTASGVAVSGAVVSATGYNYSATRSSYWNYTSVVQTDANGRYEIIVFTGSNNTFTVAPPAPLAAQVQTGFVVEADLTKDFVVTPSTVSGQVRGHQGAPLAGVTVQLVDRYDTNELVVLSAVTNQDGEYQLNLAPGTYVFKLEAADWQLPAAPNGGWYYYFDNQVTTANLDFDLPVAKVWGKVTDSGGAGVAGVVVLSKTSEWTLPSSYASQALTDDQGDYTIFVFTGTYLSLVVTPPLPLVQIVQTGVTISSDEERNYTLPTAPVSGHVRGYQGAGIPGVTVQVFNNQGEALLTTTTDSDGRYELNLGPGTYSFRLFSPYPPAANAPNDYWYIYRYEQTVDSTLDFDLGVAKVEGVVTDSNGFRVPNVVTTAAGRFSVTSGWSDYRSRAQTGTDGLFALLVFTGNDNTFTFSPPQGYSMNVLSQVVVSDDFSQAVILQSLETTPPVILEGPLVVHRSDTSASIRWMTDEPASSVVEYWPVGEEHLSKTLVGAVRDHQVTLLGLLPGASYEFRVGSTDESGNGPTWSTTRTFQTLSPPGDVAVPVVLSEPEPTVVAQTAAVIAWATDEPVTVLVHYGTSPDFPTRTALVSAAPAADIPTGECSSSGQVTLTDLLPNTTYYVQFEYWDPDGNGPTWSEILTFTTTAEPDTTPPLIATGPEAREVTDKTIKVVWTTDEATTGGVSYNDGTTYFVVSDDMLAKQHEFVLTNLVPASTYHITVSSRDMAGNGPTLAGPISVTTNSASGTPPEVVVPGPMVVEATSAAGAVVTFTATATDAEDGPLTPTCTPPSGTTLPLGETTVVCQATDSTKSSSSASFLVTVRDTTPPVMSLPEDISVPADPDGGAVVTYEATATDTVSGALTPVCTPPSGSRFPTGSTTVECVVQDAAGNRASGSFQVMVRRQNTPPTIQAPSEVIAEATAWAGAIVSFAVTATDFEDGPLAPTCQPAAGSVFPMGTTSVSCTVADSAGATANATFAVRVRDTQGPTLTLPADMTVAASGSKGAVVTFLARATDAVWGPAWVRCTPPSGSRFPIGTTTVQCSAQDLSGNKSSGTFAVTVSLPNHPPVVTVPKNIRTRADGSAGARVWYRASAHDQEDGWLAPECVPASGSLFPLGHTQVTCSATDSAGATASASFTVTVR